MTSTNLRDQIVGLADETSRLMMEVDQHIPTLGNADRLAIAERLDSALREVEVITKALRAKVAEEMTAAGLKTGSFNGLDGASYTVEISTRVSRRQVQTDDLVKRIESIVSAAPRLINSETGELISEDAAKLDALKASFRLEPRWTAISALGINDDDFCSKSFETSTKITKAVAL